MCTSIRIKSKTGDVFWGRTMDFTFDPFSVNSQITTYPKGEVMESQYENWQAKYSFMGINLDNSLLFYDGINEAGLVGDIQFFEECTWATEADLKNRQLQPLVGEEVVAYILSNFKTVAEIKEAAPKFGLLNTKFSPVENLNMGVPTPVPFHYTFCDASGESVVLEPVENGAFKIYDGIGVMTNSPEYSWHLTNLRNYIELQNANRGQLKLSDALAIKQIESGSGLLGMPGDYTAPSRFVRSVFLSNFSAEFESNQGINHLRNLFSSVMVPMGVERVAPDKETNDFTGYWIGYDLTNKALYIQPEDCSTFTVKKLNVSAEKIESVAISHDLLVHEV